MDFDEGARTWLQMKCCAGDVKVSPVQQEMHACDTKPSSKPVTLAEKMMVYPLMNVCLYDRMLERRGIILLVDAKNFTPSTLWSRVHGF